MLIESKILNRARGGEKWGWGFLSLSKKGLKNKRRRFAPRRPTFQPFFALGPRRTERPTTKWHFYYKRQIFFPGRQKKYYWSEKLGPKTGRLRVKDAQGLSTELSGISRRWLSNFNRENCFYECELFSLISSFQTLDFAQKGTKYRFHREKKGWF